MERFSRLMKGVTKSYLYTHLARDVARFVRRNLSDIELDRDYWLKRAGLAPRRPLNGVLLLAAGMVAGAGAALALAPKPGRQLRTEVRERAMTWFNRAEQDARAAANARLS
jgi:hypothetical protein